DLTPLGINGQQGSDRAEDAAIVVNKNLIPYDPQPATKASGLRIGSACATTRGLGEQEMVEAGRFLYRALTAENEDDRRAIAEEVGALLDDSPAPFLQSLEPASS